MRMCALADGKDGTLILIVTFLVKKRETPPCLLYLICV